MNYSSPYGYIRDGKVYLISFGETPERIIGEVRQDASTSLKYYEERFEIIRKKIEDLEAKIEASENKGSYLMKLLHLRDYILTFDALGDYEPILAKLDLIESDLRRLIKDNKRKNLELKQAMLLEAEKIAECPFNKESTERFKELRTRWIKTGSVDAGDKGIEEKFQQISESFFSRKKQFYEEKKKLIDERIEKYHALLECLNLYLNKIPDKHSIKSLKDIQAQWKKVGRIPATVKKDLDEKFEAVINPIFSQYREHNISISNNNKIKEDILLRFDTLLQNIDGKASETLKILKDEWFNSGRSGKELESAFYTKCDLVNEKIFLEKIAHSKIKNLASKTEKEKCKIKWQIMQELLSRDQHQLEVFKENLEKLNAKEDSFKNLMTSKLNSHYRKVKIKQQIIKELSEKMDAL